MAACTPSVSQHPMREGTGNATESSMPYNRRAMSKMMLYVFTPNVSSSCASPLPGVRADSRRFADRDDGLTFDLLGTCTFTQLRFLLFLYVGRPVDGPALAVRYRTGPRGFDRGLRTGAMDAPRGGLGLSPIAQVICRPVPNHPASRCGTQPPTPTCRIPATCATTHLTC